MKELEKAKKVYESIRIPKELHSAVDESLNRKYVENPVKKTSIRHRLFPTIMTTCLAMCCLFVVLVNTNETFAKTVENIPIVNQVAKLVTVKSYTEEDDSKLIYANIPAIENTGNSDLEQRINYEIREKMNSVLEEVNQRAKDYQDAVLATGGTLEDYNPIHVDINYEMKYSGEDVVSFVINKCETLASAYTEQYIYNIDLKTGKELNLRDVLGEDYKEIVDNEIYKQIEERKKNPDNYYFTQEEGGFDGIENEYQNFYINKNRKVVIVFYKYEIAPGSMGMQEFEIPNEIMP